MNLRILKKLSKRAAPLLILLGDEREQFRSARGEWHDMPFIGDRKHWHRTSCRQDHEPRNDWLRPRGKQIKFTTRKGFTMLMEPPRAPRKGTVMVGNMAGCEESEWSDETAWSALQTLVLNHFTADECFAAWANWDEEGELPAWRLTRPLKKPSEVFKAAEEILRERHVLQRARAFGFFDLDEEIGGAA
jgi:hypothetical protein